MFALSICALIIFCTNLPAELADSTNGERHSHSTGFRSIQVDAVSIIFIEGIALSLDYDLIRLSKRSTIGFRAGVERYSAASIGGSVDGSPFQDYNILARTTTSGSRFRWDIYTGLAFHRSVESSSYEPRTGLRLGMDFRYYLIPHYCALMLKLNTGALGLGLSIGYDTK